MIDFVQKPEVSPREKAEREFAYHCASQHHYDIMN